MNENLSFQESFDVAVIGCGPAGATLATFLQRQGHRCLILEGSTFPRYHVGESLKDSFRQIAPFIFAGRSWQHSTKR